MKKYFYFLFLSLIVLQFSTLSYGQTTQKERLEKHVYYMAADSLKGRRAGSKEAQKVAEYIRNQFEEIGLTTKMQSFTPRIIPQNNKVLYQNVIGVWEGSDPLLKGELIVIGAHYDHLGVKFKKGKEIIYNGADDNASGTAALIELARNLVQQKELTKRSLVFVAFDAEEIGLFGSKAYADMLESDMDQDIVLMINFDMVGYLKQSEKLKIIGVGSLQYYQTYFNKVYFPEYYRLVLDKKDHSFLTGSDHDSFLAKKIPAFHVTTGLKSPYHKPEDDPHLIDYEGISIIVDYFTELVPLFANEVFLLQPSEALKNSGLKTKSSYLGIVAGIGNMHYKYLYGTMDGKNGTALQLGLYGKVSLGNRFALKGEAAYSFTNRYRKEGIIQTHEVTLPVVLFLKTSYEDWQEMSIGVGGYYSHFFHLREKNFDPIVKQYYPYEVGWMLDLEMRFSRIIYGFQYRYGLNDMIVAPQEEDMARSRIFQFKVGFIF